MLQDECATGNHRCGGVGGTCSGGAGFGYSCSCSTGFMLDPGTGMMPQCYRSGSFTLGGTQANGTYGFAAFAMNATGYCCFQNADFYATDSDDFLTAYANNSGQLGVQQVNSTAPLLQVPVPAAGYQRFGVPIVVGQTYVARVREPNADYYTIFRVVRAPAMGLTNGFTADYVVVYRPPGTLAP